MVLDVVFDLAEIDSIYVYRAIYKNISKPKCRHQQFDCCILKSSDLFGLPLDFQIFDISNDKRNDFLLVITRLDQ